MTGQEAGLGGRRKEAGGRRQEEGTKGRRIRRQDTGDRLQE